MTELEPFTLALIPGKFSANRRVFARYVRAVVRQSGASAFITTESVGAELALRALMGPKWRITRGGEYATGTLRADWKRTRWSSLQRVARFYKADRDDWRNLWVDRNTIEQRSTAVPVLFVAGHVPKRSNQLAAHNLSLTTLGRVLAGVRARRPDVEVVVAMDTNGDHHDPEVRDAIETMMRMPSNWTHHRPVGGSHGRRLIDAVYATVTMSKWRISRAPKGRGGHVIDHTATVGVVGG